MVRRNDVSKTENKLEKNLGMGLHSRGETEGKWKSMRAVRQTPPADKE